MKIRLAANPEVQAIVFLLQPHFSLLAFTAAADVLATANLVSGKQRYRIETVSTTQRSLVSDLGIEITTDRSIHDTASDSLALTANFLIVCGGYRCSLAEQHKVSALLQRAAQCGITLGSLWNGVYAIAHSGLMDGYSCALHPDNQSLFGERFPRVHIRHDSIVIDRQRVSAAGPVSALDLMLMLIQRHDDAETVQSIRDILRADASVTQGEYSALERDKEQFYPATLRTTLQLMRSNLDEPLERADLARHANLSTRALERLFHKHVGNSPSRHYLELRLRRAHELLAQSDSPVGDISLACGFVSAAHFSRSFSHRFGYPPKAVRQSAGSWLKF
jgi:transcriptional regulator GlxA family with amidase domain